MSKKGTGSEVWIRPFKADGRVCMSCLKSQSIEREVEYCSAKLHSRSHRGMQKMMEQSCCGLSYCSPRCKEKDYRHGHWLLCRERNASQSIGNNSVEFARFLKTSPQGDRIEMAALLFSRLLLRDLGVQDDGNGDEHEIMDDTGGDIWSAFERTWPLTSSSGGGTLGDDEYDSSDIFVLIRGMILYEKIMSLDFVINLSSQTRKRKRATPNREDLRKLLETVVTLQHWTTVNKVVMQYSLNVSLESPVVKFINKMSVDASCGKVNQLEDKLVSTFAQSSLSTCESNRSLSNSSIGAFVAKSNPTDWKVAALIKLAEGTADMLRPTSIPALLLSKSLRQFPHSCLPTHSVHVALKEIRDTRTDKYMEFDVSPVRLSSENGATKKGGPPQPTINWLGSALSLDKLPERQQELKQKFGNEFCCQHCPLCAHQEMGTGGSSSVEASMTMPVIYHKMDVERQDFQEAEELLRQLIDKYEHGHEVGEAYHALGACLLNQGKWREAQAAWSEGATIVPHHERLKDIAARLEAFDLKAVDESLERDTSADCHALDVGGSRVVKERGASTSTILLSKTRVIDSKKCEWLVAAAEEYARKTGWSTQRHYGAPTTDIPLSLMPLPVLEWFKEFFVSIVTPLLKLHYFRPEERGRAIVSIHDAFLVKYSAEGGQRYLPEHTDESSHSFVLALNQDTEYEGGGTFFTRIEAALRPPLGHLLLFPGGNIRHGGNPITRGTRYIIAAFLFLGLEAEQGGKEAAEAKDDGFTFGFF